MNTTALKQYIYQNNKVEYILDKIQCKNIKYHTDKQYYSCANYNGDNPSAVNIYNNQYLNVNNWTRKKEFGDHADIIDLVQYNKQCSFKVAVKYIHELLGIDYKGLEINNTKNNKRNPLIVFEKYLSSKNNVKEIEYLSEDLMDYYVPLLYIGWLREGITQRTARKFGIAYSYSRKRIIIPIRDWLTGRLVGINQRTVVDNWDILGIRKYLISTNYQKHLNLYGLYENYDSIQKAGYVVIAESEKSVLKRDSLCDSTVVALSGHTISDEQVRILIGLNVEIVVALDKDIDIQEVRFICEKFYHIRSVSYIYDRWDLMKDKESPMDSRNKVYKFLFEHRIKYDEVEHKKYLQEMKKE